MRKGVIMGTAMVIALAGTAQALPADFKAKADQLVKKSFAADQPGAAVIVTEDGRIVRRLSSQTNAPPTI